MPEFITLLVTSAVAVEGLLYRKGSLLSVPEDVAMELLRLGRAEVATVENVKEKTAVVAELDNLKESTNAIVLPVDQPTAPRALEQPSAADVEVKAPDPAASPLEQLTKAQLLDKAKELGVEVKASDTKAQITTALTSAAK